MVAPVAAPANLASYETSICGRTRKLLTSLPRNETIDWAKTVSSELTVTMLATLFDFSLKERHRIADILANHAFKARHFARQIEISRNIIEGTIFEEHHDHIVHGIALREPCPCGSKR